MAGGFFCQTRRPLVPQLSLHPEEAPVRIFFADKFPARSKHALQALGFELRSEPDLRGEDLISAIRGSDADALVVRSTKVTGEMMDQSRLTLVVRSGSGVDNIDVGAASRLGIYVSNCPGKNAHAVAELTLAMMLALDRRVPDHINALRQGQWNKKLFAATEGPAHARGLYGRTLGVVGMGRIGRLVVERARAFGMRVVTAAHRMDGDAADRLGVELRELPEDVAAEGDFVSVHLPLTPSTRGLCGHAFFDAMKPGAVFVNTSRGEIVDEEALTKALDAKGILAGLDVFAGEPAEGTGPFHSVLAQHPAVYGTHHIGASTAQAQEATADETVRILRVFSETGRAPNVVNLCRRSPATHVLSVRHFDRVGVLAHVLNGLRSTGINVQEMENVVFDGAEAAIARIHMDRAPAQGVLENIHAGNKDIMELRILSLPPAGR
jgi:D-3-phosphoglycerate dehydrogenase